MRIVCRRADRVLRAAPGKAAIGWPTVDAVGAWIEDFRLLEAEAVREDVLIVDVIVYLGIEGMGLLYPHLAEYEVGLSKRGSRNIRPRQKTKQLLSNRADAVSTDHV